MNVTELNELTKSLNEEDFELFLQLLDETQVEKVEYSATKRVYTVTCKEN